MTTVNGVRVTLDDGTWGLVRASSNKPNLVVVVESPASQAQTKAMFHDIEKRPPSTRKSANTIKELIIWGSVIPASSN